MSTVFTLVILVSGKFVALFYPTCIKFLLLPSIRNVKSVQSALSNLLTTSGPRGTFSRLSTTRGCISIIELLQFTIVVPFGQVEARLCIRKRAIKMLLSNERPIIALGL